MDWLRDHVWAGWLALAVVLGALELLSLDLFLVMLAGGALVGGVTAPRRPVRAADRARADHRGRPAGADPAQRRHRLHTGPTLRTGADALIGKRATVLRELAYGTPGRVKIGGEEWTAEPYDEDDRIEPGEVVDVVRSRARRPTCCASTGSGRDVPATTGERRGVPMGAAVLVLFALLLVFVVLVLAKTIRIVPQARAGIVERFGKYKTTLHRG